VEDCERGIERWNKIIAEHGIEFRLRLPHVAFHRQIGEFRAVHVSPTGELLDDGAWERSKDAWLPTAADGDFIASLMQPETQPGQFARWIAPPRVGIDNRPGDFEYVQIAG
jgi:benzoyl-CoA 2,3-dioxygenase component B